MIIAHVAGHTKPLLACFKGIANDGFNMPRDPGFSKRIHQANTCPAFHVLMTVVVAHDDEPAWQAVLLHPECGHQR